MEVGENEFESFFTAFEPKNPENQGQIISGVCVKQRVKSSALNEFDNLKQLEMAKGEFVIDESNNDI